MSSHQAQNAFDLLGQFRPPASSVYLPALGTWQTPKFSIAWESFHTSAFSNAAALIRAPHAPRKFLGGVYFRDCWVQRRIPILTVLAAAILHFIFVLIPWPSVYTPPRRVAALENTQLTWSGPINDLPLLNIPAPVAKAGTRAEIKTPPAAGADAFHPRQRIFTDPARPNHPRQTLIQPSAPALVPKIPINLPNIVEFQQSAGPARPRLEISQQSLAKLHPRERKVAAATAVPLPDAPALNQKVAEINLAPANIGPERPKLQLNASAAPHVAQRTQPGDSAPSPDLGAANPTGAETPSLIALSNNPGPPAPEIPKGNSAARVSISPEGKTPGIPGGAPTGTATAAGYGKSPNAVDPTSGPGVGGANSKNPVGVVISGGNPVAKSSSSGAGNSISAPSNRRLITIVPKSRADTPEASERTGPPNFSTLPPGVEPEKIFGSKKHYKLLVNMPNLNSSTGSWVLNFSELRTSADAPHTTDSELAGPIALTKIDPKYPPSLIHERVDGEVVLYAVIRKDGSVDSVEVVHGLDEQLDENAMQALRHWKFQPGSRHGEPVNLEAIIHIPFHATGVQ